MRKLILSLTVALLIGSTVCMAQNRQKGKVDREKRMEQMITDLGLNEKQAKDFKAAMDKYKAFIDEYVTFIKKYEEEGRPLSMLSEYTELMTQYTEFAETMAAYNGDNLSAADYAYYIEVMGRVSQKLLELN